jgi:hypothetical protein
LEKKWEIKSLPKLILSAINSNIQSEENKDIYVKGLAKAAVDARMYTLKSLYFNNKFILI